MESSTADTRRHLADLVEEALVNGFDRVELERELRAGFLAPVGVPAPETAEAACRTPGATAWRLRVGPMSGPCGEKLLLEAALADAGYVTELGSLIRLWAEHGIPEEDRAAETRADSDRQALSDLAFFVRVLEQDRRPRSEIAQMLFGAGFDARDVVAAFREVFELRAQD